MTTTAMVEGCIDTRSVYSTAHRQDLGEFLEAAGGEDVFFSLGSYGLCAFSFFLVVHP
jgi:hypothetical protein